MNKKQSKNAMARVWPALAMMATIWLAGAAEGWAADLAAGSQYGYALLWVVTLSTVMLIVLQNNAARLGIVYSLEETIIVKPLFLG